MKNKIIGLFIALVLGMSLLSCAVPSQPVVQVEDSVTEIPLDLAPDLTVDEVAELFSDSTAVIVDVREDYEYAAGHIPGAVLIPLGDLANRSDEIPTNVPVVLVCRSGNRSGQAYNALVKLGFDNVHNMLGGMNDWSARGYEVEQ